MEYFLTDSLKLNAERTEDGAYIVRLSNGKEITVQKDMERNGSKWAWRIDSQYFSNDRYAEKYLRELVAEKLTGKRIIYHAKGEAPDICGFEGRACRAPHECNRALCSYCPIAEAFFAERDGVELVYAV